MTRTSYMKRRSRKPAILNAIIGIPALIVFIGLALVMIWYGASPYPFSLGRIVAGIYIVVAFIRYLISEPFAGATAVGVIALGIVFAIIISRNNRTRDDFKLGP